MTINKSQGESLKDVGIYLPILDFFSHGQLSMAISRLQHMNNGIFLCDKNEDNLNITSNVVYRDVCQNLNKMLILYVYSL